MVERGVSRLRCGRSATPGQEVVDLRDLVVGGPPGFEMFLEAIADPARVEHGHLLDRNVGPFDPEDIERDAITIQIGRLANMRRPKTSRRTRSPDACPRELPGAACPMPQHTDWAAITWGIVTAGWPKVDRRPRRLSDRADRSDLRPPNTAQGIAGEALRRAPVVRSKATVTATAAPRRDRLSVRGS